jgi:hypothetical protein
MFIPCDLSISCCVHFLRRDTFGFDGLHDITTVAWIQPTRMEMLAASFDRTCWGISKALRSDWWRLVYFARGKLEDSASKRRSKGESRSLCV